MSRSRAIRMIAALMCVAALCSAAAVWMVFQHVPAWYQPRGLSRAEIRRVQREADASFNHITQQLAAGETAAITLTARELNDLLAARADLWPTAGTWPSPDFSGPFVAFEERSARVGMRHHWGTIQSIWSARLRPVIDDQSIALNIDELRAGSWRVPAMLWPDGAPSSTDSRSEQRAAAVQGVGQAWTEGLKVRNRFHWPNGSIPFSIAELDLRDDRLTIRLAPAYGP